MVVREHILMIQAKEITTYGLEGTRIRHQREVGSARDSDARSLRPELRRATEQQERLKHNIIVVKGAYQEWEPWDSEVDGSTYQAAPSISSFDMRDLDGDQLGGHDGQVATPLLGATRDTSTSR